MNAISSVKKGFVAGGIISFLSILFIIIAWGAIEDKTIDGGSTEEGGVIDWAIRWAAIAIVLGVVASIMFPFISDKLHWTKTQYVFLALSSMAILDLLVYLPIYDGSVRVYPIAYLGLNAIFCVGFGAMIPELFDDDRHRGLAH